MYIEVETLIEAEHFSKIIIYSILGRGQTCYLGRTVHRGGTFFERQLHSNSREPPVKESNNDTVLEMLLN